MGPLEIIGFTPLCVSRVTWSYSKIKEVTDLSQEPGMNVSKNYYSSLKPFLEELSD